MNEELCYENFRRVEEVLDRYDPKLAELFHRSVRPMMEELCYEKSRGSSSLFPIKDGNLIDIFGILNLTSL